jgi:hypothetical protein
MASHKALELYKSWALNTSKLESVVDAAKPRGPRSAFHSWTKQHHGLETCDESSSGDAADEIGQERKASLYLQAPLCDSSA